MELDFTYPTIFSIFIAIIIFIQVKIRFTNRGYKNQLEHFVKEEYKVNLIRKKNIDESFFVTPLLDNLPLVSIDGVAHSKAQKAQEVVLRKAKLKMVKFEYPMTNFQLKQLFGMNHLQQIITYEEHYEMYITALNEWALALFDENKYDDAAQVLNECIAFGSDYLSTFVGLIDVYAKQARYDQIEKFLSIVERKSNIYGSRLVSKITAYAVEKTTSKVS